MPGYRVSGLTEFSQCLLVDVLRLQQALPCRAQQKVSESAIQRGRALLQVCAGFAKRRTAEQDDLAAFPKESIPSGDFKVLHAVGAVVYNCVELQDSAQVVKATCQDSVVLSTPSPRPQSSLLCNITVIGCSISALAILPSTWLASRSSEHEDRLPQTLWTCHIVKASRCALTGLRWCGCFGKYALNAFSQPLQHRIDVPLLLLMLTALQVISAAEFQPGTAAVSPEGAGAIASPDTSAGDIPEPCNRMRQLAVLVVTACKLYTEGGLPLWCDCVQPASRHTPNNTLYMGFPAMRWQL